MLDIERDPTVVASVKESNQMSTHSNRPPFSVSEFKAIKQFAERNLLAIVEQLLPGGKVIGKEYVVRNPMRDDKRAGSFKICISGPKAGVWSDFATSDKGGDLLMLVSHVKRISRGEAARWIKANIWPQTDFG